MKILYFIGYPHRMSGSQRQLEALIVKMNKIHDVCLLLPAHGAVYDHFTNKGIKTEVLNPGKNLSSYGKVLLKKGKLKLFLILLKEYLPFSIKLRKFIKRREIDIVHSNDGRATILLAMALRFLKVKKVGHLQGERAISSNRLWSIVENIPDIIIANANFVKKTLSEKIWSKTKVVHTGLAELLPQKLESNFLKRQKQERVIITCFASLVPFKGYHHLFNAIAKLVKDESVPDFLLICLGDFVREYEDYHSYLNDLIEQNKISEYVLFTGWRDDPISFLDFADISVLPSVKEELINYRGLDEKVEGNEGFPTTHLEAMQLGKPIIGTDIAGVSEQIQNNYNGLLVQPGDVEALYEALKTLLCSEEKRKSFGLNARKYYEANFSQVQYVEKVDKIYADLINAK